MRIKVKDYHRGGLSRAFEFGLVVSTVQDCVQSIGAQQTAVLCG